MRIHDAKCRYCRREGVKLFLKGQRCFSAKCPVERRGGVPPGVHGMKRGRKPSDYGIQLREKQKIKRLYGITERQLKAYYQTAAKERAATGEALLRQLEMRLDNALFRAGFVPSRSVARQVVNHGGVLVNGKRVDIVSAQVKPADTITLSTKALNQGIVKETLAAKQSVPAWLARKAAVVKVERAPQREEMETMINERQIVEFYSR